MLRPIVKLSIVLAVCGLLAAPNAMAAERKIRINNSAWATLEHPVTVYFSVKPCELLNAVSGGKFDIRYHPSYTLVGPKDGYQAVITGMTPFNLVLTAATPGVFPLLDLFSLPGLFPNQSTSNAVVRDLLEKYPQFEQELDPAVHSVFPRRSICALTCIQGYPSVLLPS